jgi:hypothetical protein
MNGFSKRREIMSRVGSVRVDAFGPGTDRKIGKLKP